MSPINVRLGLQQRVLPEYRIPFFEMLADDCEQGLGIFAGSARRQEAIAQKNYIKSAQLTSARNIHLLNGKAYLCWQAGLIKWLENFQPEVLILEANPRYILSSNAARWMHQRSRPVIGWGLGAPVQQGRLAGIRQNFRRQFIEKFDAVITYSGQGAAEYQSLGFPAQRIFVAPNAAAARPISPIPQRSAQFKDGKPVLLYVGRLQARKRIDFLLRACAAFPQEKQPVLWIIGDGPEREELQNLAKEIFPAAQFWGAKHGEELRPFFEEADLFVLPGTGGLAVQQAMSFGLPVIVAEADGTQTDLVRPENGWCIPPGDFAALGFAIQNALSDVGRLRRMGAASFRIVSEEINLENMVNIFEQAVEFVLEGK